MLKKHQSVAAWRAPATWLGIANRLPALAFPSFKSASPPESGRDLPAPCRMQKQPKYHGASELPISLSQRACYGRAQSQRSDEVNEADGTSPCFATEQYGHSFLFYAAMRLCRKTCIPPATSPLLRLLLCLNPTAACDNVLGRQLLNCPTCNNIELALSSRELLDSRSGLTPPPPPRRPCRCSLASSRDRPANGSSQPAAQ